MSNILEMPGPGDYTGRTVILNQATCKRFQCPGFVLGPNAPYQVVPDLRLTNESLHLAMMDGLRQGLLDGRLLDVTGQDTKGMKLGSGEHSPVSEEEDPTRPRVLMGTDKRGRIYILTPRDKQHEAELITELKDTGTLANVHFDEPQVGSNDTPVGLGRVEIAETLPAPTIILTDPQ
jgi:hypothetical protein